MAAEVGITYLMGDKDLLLDLPVASQEVAKSPA
jgi:hypothetical protein